jgi:predicted thioredoxin/glutaredoxin
VFLHAEWKKLKNIISGFPVDKIDKKEEVIKLMEGSIKSFGKRKDRYGI